jgi:DNA polymerase-3 subunit delta'
MPRSVWSDVVDQEPVVRQLQEAVTAAAASVVTPGSARGSGTTDAMTHAWLFTGPPGSGRSVAARAFAAALQCPDQGCGSCSACRTVLAGSHPDVRIVVPQRLHLVIAEARRIVADSARTPYGGRWHVTVIEDADRMEERTGDTLLKTLEEPPPRTVLMLCAPSPEDVLPTIRSRCRAVRLRTPSVAAITAVLRREGVDSAMGAFAARASLGHLGRARRLATDAQARQRRHDALSRAAAVGSVPACLGAAADLVAAAAAEATAETDAVDAAEVEGLRQALGAGLVRGSGKTSTGLPRGGAAELKELESSQRSRRTRRQRDSLDRALVDVAALYRDVLALQLGARVAAYQSDQATAVTRLAHGSRPESTLRRIEAVLACRQAIDASVAPLLAVEALALTLART